MRQPGVLVAAVICEGSLSATGVAESVVRIFSITVPSAEAGTGSATLKDSTRERTVISVSRRSFIACIISPSEKHGGRENSPPAMSIEADRRNQSRNPSVDYYSILSTNGQGKKQVIVACDRKNTKYSVCQKLILAKMTNDYGQNRLRYDRMSFVIFWEII